MQVHVEYLDETRRWEVGYAIGLLGRKPTLSLANGNYRSIEQLVGDYMYEALAVNTGVLLCRGNTLWQMLPKGAFVVFDLHPFNRLGGLLGFNCIGHLPNSWDF